jgi:hypothetical protein
MATADGLSVSTPIVSNKDYYPLLSSSTTGVSANGTDETLKYNSGTLTTTNLDVTTINGSPYVGPTYFNTMMFPKIKLSSTWTAIGDSYTRGGAWDPTWGTYLAALTGTTYVNKGVGSTTSDYGSNSNSITNDSVVNPSYADRSTIIMYGFNDVRNNKTLYSNFYAWTQNVLCLALTNSLPQNKIQLPRDDSWLKSGTWVDSPVNDIGTYSALEGDYIEKNMGTIRYLAIRHTIVDPSSPADAGCRWEVRVNGVLVNTFAWTSLVECQSSANYRPSAYMIDLGVETPNALVRITNAHDKGQNQFIDFDAGWVDEDVVSARDVLFLSIPRFNYDFTGGAPWDAPSDAKRSQMNEGMEQVALMCRRVGLPVSFFRVSDAQGNFHTDSVHPSPRMSEQWAKQIRDYAIV